VLVACEGCGCKLERWPSHVMKRVFCESCRGASGRGGLDNASLAQRQQHASELYRTMTAADVSRTLGVSKKTVLRDLEQAGIERRPGGSPNRDDRRQRVAVLYEAGGTMDAIAAELDISLQTVW